jgi:hypothetical protein
MDDVSIKIWKRNCPKCNLVVEHKSYDGWRGSVRTNRQCKKCQAEAAKRKIVPPQIGIGETNGMLTLLSYKGMETYPSGRSEYLGEFRCECGKTCVRKLKLVKKKSTQSCGCLYGKDKLLPGGKAEMNKVYRGYIDGARRRGLAFKLNKDDFVLISKQPCHYCGCLPSNRQSLKDNSEFVYNGVDRKDSNIGYIKENCLPCCFWCNRSKSTMTVNDFISKCEQVIKYSKAK